jgi:hypothetical protein
MPKASAYEEANRLRDYDISFARATSSSMPIRDETTQYINHDTYVCMPNCMASPRLICATHQAGKCDTLYHADAEIRADMHKHHIFE